uniref:Uncharacterized protein n=1 Tax=Seriola lalandi dorsalis TaxID=1841481 RepID=A0A3B4WJV6_SERLL
PFDLNKELYLFFPLCEEVTTAHMTCTHQEPITKDEQKASRYLPLLVLLAWLGLL